MFLNSLLLRFCYGFVLKKLMKPVMIKFIEIYDFFG